MGGKKKLDTNLPALNKIEVANAMIYLNDPQALHVMAATLQASGYPIASKLLEDKSAYLHNYASQGSSPQQVASAGANYPQPNVDYS